MKKLLLILFAFLSFCSFGQIVLTDDSPAHTLEVVTTSTSNIDYLIEFFDEVSPTGAGNGQSIFGSITTATTTTVLGAPAVSTNRKVLAVTLSNTGAEDNVITVKIDIASTDEVNLITTLKLKGGESLYYNSNGWSRSPALNSTVTGITKSMTKVSTASDAPSYWMGGWKDSGTIGAWSPGTPGLAGRATNGNDLANDAGCLSFPDAGAGKARYLTGVDLNANIVNAYYLFDVLWVNSGVVVTTTTGQTINSVTLPARSDDGTTNGEGAWIGVYATSALGNAATVFNSTVTYTNSAGTGSRTATLSNNVGWMFPATPVIGTVVWFQLQAGDTGVQSIQTLTLNTTLTSGSLSLFIARPIVGVPLGTTSSVAQKVINDGKGVLLYDDACLLPFWASSVINAPSFIFNVTTVER